MYIKFLWGNRTMAKMNSNLQLMFGNSGPEGPDHDGENGHEENDDQTGVETFIVLCQCHKTFFLFCIYNTLILLLDTCG